jgi:hypothetical protein
MFIIALVLNLVINRVEDSVADVFLADAMLERRLGVFNDSMYHSVSLPLFYLKTALLKSRNRLFPP